MTADPIPNALRLLAVLGFTMLSLNAQESRYFRISGLSATAITSVSPDGTVTWSNAAPGITCTFQTTTDLTGTNWVDYVQSPITNTTMALRLFDPAPPPGMVLIPAGSFTMGDNLGDGYSSGELPLHTVYVSAFYMDQYEVSKSKWDTVYQWAITHGYTFDFSGSGKAANHPVQTINWYDCVKWCNARSEQEGRVPAYYTTAGQTSVYRIGKTNVQDGWVNWNAGYRLPTEAEWEKAARGGASGHRLPWSNVDTITHSQANYYSSTNCAYDISPTLGFHSTFATGGYPYTSPVGYFASNGYGLYDMAGNVWEWCWDRYGSYSSGSQTDPRGPASGSNRVFRGGGWSGNAIYCRAAYRDIYAPGDRRDYIGFRSVLPSGQP